MEHHRKITEEQERTVVSMHKTGATAQEIATTLAVHRNTIYQALWRNGLVKSRPGRLRAFTDEQIQDMAQLYQSGWSQQAVADKYGTTADMVCHYFRRAGIQCRPAGFQTGENHVGWVGGRITLSTGYVAVRIYPEDPYFSMAVQKADGASYVLENRYVMAKKLGRPLRDDETVHHKDGNKQNNKEDNLQLRVGRHGKGAAFCCADCGSRNIVPVAIVEPS
jgi:transposase